MTDLGKLEEKFHEFLKTGLSDKAYNVDLVKVTEDLFGQIKAFYIAFGFISYFLPFMVIVFPIFNFLIYKFILFNIFI